MWIEPSGLESPERHQQNRTLCWDGRSFIRASSDDYFQTGVGLKGSCCCEVCGSRDAATASPLCLSPRLHCCCSSHSLSIGWSMMLNPPPPKRSGANQPPVPPPPPHFRRGRSIQTPLVFHYNLALFVCLFFNSFCVLQRQAFQPWISTWKATAELQLQRCCRLLVVVKV